MLSSKVAQQIASELPGVTGKDHFGSDGLYVNKRIFATVWHDKNEVNLRLNPEQQRNFVAKKAKAFSEIPNAFGRRGWTTIKLEFVDQKLFAQALKAAWENSALMPTRSPRRSKRA